MVEENAATGARLDGELERARGECATLRGELRDVRGALPIVLNNNNAGNGGANSNNNSGTATGVSGGNANPGQEAEAQQQAQQEDGKRLSAGSSPIEKRSSASDKSASPIEKRTSPVDRKDRTSPIDRRGSPVGLWQNKALPFWYYLLPFLLHRGRFPKLHRLLNCTTASENSTCTCTMGLFENYLILPWCFITFELGTVGVSLFTGSL